ncbi:hypothetical protein M3Y98_00152200 [Aphelenchoides besseyi]|nr:hypothetical protein M3Y98_00152200 [Aphelenchoides besseyi]
MPSRCQYVSGLFLQCNNLLNSSAPSTSAKPAKDEVIFCDKHSTFIETVKAHANVSKRALDPDFKIPPHLTPIEDPYDASKPSAPPHVFEPSCSDSWAYDDENPLRNAGFLTEKEIVRQHDAALGRMLENVQEILGKDESERAKLLRLKSDMSYAPYSKYTSNFLEKIRRKQLVESSGLRGQAHVDSWLESEEYTNGEGRCDFVHDSESSSKPVSSFYHSPSTDSPADILQSICDAVVEQEKSSMNERRCKGRRIPMIDYCIEHSHLANETYLFVSCTACKAPSLLTDGRLCRKHARRMYVKPTVETVPLQNGARTLLPNHSDRQHPLRPALTSGRTPLNGTWKLTNRPATGLTNGHLSSVVNNGPEMRSTALRTYPQITRKPRNPHRQLAEDEKLPNEAFFVEQTNTPTVYKGIPSYTIDEDLPLHELEEMCRKRKCLDLVAEIPLDKQPHATLPPQTLRVNGFNGALTNSPLAVVSVPDSLSGSAVFNQQPKSIRHNPNNVPSCARVRPFMSSSDLRNFQSVGIGTKIQKPPQIIDHRHYSNQAFRLRGNIRPPIVRTAYIAPPPLFVQNAPPLRLPGKVQMVSDTRKATFLLCIVAVNAKTQFESFQNPSTNDFGLVNDQNEPCLVLRFHARLYNFNLNGTDIATELADFTLKDVRLSGYCALHNEVRKHAQLQADWSTAGRRKMLRFEFRESFVRVFGQQVDELRWQLHRITYVERYNGKTIKFQSANNSVVVSAPLRQKFICKDRLNVTLYHSKFQNIVVEFLPEIDFQPLNTGTGFGSNVVYVCERTRRRTLAESFDSRMTVFSGVVLGISSVGTLVGYSLRRQLKPSRREIYNFIS